MMLGMLGVGLIPQFIYQKKISDLQQDIDRLHISLSQNHPVKLESYKEFIENFFDVLKLKSPQVQQKRLLELFKNISNAVFLFGNDETIKSFLVIRSQAPILTEEQKYINLVNTAKFMVQPRKDLNCGQSDITADDYLRLLINDWDQTKDKIKKYL
jgi:hypothetical protein